MRKIFSWIVILLFGLIVIGCAAKMQTVEIPPEKTEVGFSQITTVAPSEKPTTTVTKTFVLTQTETIQPSITPTQIPTYSADELYDFLVSKSEYDDQCRLPCIWGIDPEHTDEDAVVDFVSSFGDADQFLDYFVHFSTFNNSKILRLMLNDGNREIWTDLSIVHDENMIYSFFSTDTWARDEESYKQFFSNPPMEKYFNQYTVSEIMEQYGEPEQVYIFPMPDEPSYSEDIYDPMPFYILLFDSEDGYFLQYILSKDTSEKDFIGCFQNTYTINLMTWNPNEKKDIDEFLREIPDFTFEFLSEPIFIQYYRPIDDIMPKGVFYEKYKSTGGQTCIHAPIDS